MNKKQWFLIVFAILLTIVISIAGYFALQSAKLSNVLNISISISDDEINTISNGNNNCCCCSCPSYVSLWFDDGYASTFEEAFPIMQDRGWPGVVAIVADHEIAQEKFGLFNDPVMPWEQVDILAENGWEISSHSTTHPFLNNTDIGAFEYEIVESKNALTNRGYEVNSFTFPYGQNGGDVGQQLISDNYDYWRSSTTGVNPLPAWRHITDFYVESTTTIEDVEGWLQEGQCGWTVLNIHNIQDEPTNEWAITPEFFFEIVEAVENSGAQVVTPEFIYSQYGYAENQ